MGQTNAEIRQTQQSWEYEQMHLNKTTQKNTQTLNFADPTRKEEENWDEWGPEGWAVPAS